MSDKAKGSLIVTLAFSPSIQDESGALTEVKKAMETTRFKVYPTGLIKDDAGRRFLVQFRPLKANEAADGTKGKANQVAKLLGAEAAPADEGTVFLKYIQANPHGAPLTIPQLVALRHKALGIEVVSTAGPVLVAKAS